MLFDTAQIVTLIISVGLTLLVAWLLVTAGEPFLQEVFEDPRVARSVNLLLAVLFLLITLGVLSIISASRLFLMGSDPVSSTIGRLGVVLLVLGVAYGISMLVLIRVRERRKAAQISEQVQERLAERGNPTPAPAPQPAQYTTRPTDGPEKAGPL